MNKLLALLFLILISCNGPEKVETPEASEPKQKVQENYDKSIVQDTFQLDQNGVNALSGGNFGFYNSNQSKISINNRPLEIDVWNDFIITFFVRNEVPETGIIKLERSDGKIKEIPYKKSNNITLYDKLVMVDDPEYDENGYRVDYWETKNEIIFRALNNYDSLKLIYPDMKKRSFNWIDERGRDFHDISVDKSDYHNYESNFLDPRLFGFNIREVHNVFGKMIKPILIGNTVYYGIEVDGQTSYHEPSLKFILLEAYDNMTSAKIGSEDVSLMYDMIVEFDDSNSSIPSYYDYFAQGVFEGIVENGILFETKPVNTESLGFLKIEQLTNYENLEITSKIIKLGSNGFEYYETLEEAIGESK